MMTSTNVNIFHVTDFSAGKSPIAAEFPAQRSAPEQTVK